MRGSNKMTYGLLYLFLLSPMIAYIYTVWLNLPKNITYIYIFITFILGVYFILSKRNIYYPKFALFAFFFAIYYLICRLITNPESYFLTKIYYDIIFFSICFFLIVIYNTTFPDIFIKNCIFIIKITVILTCAVSIIQVFFINFLNPLIYISEDFGSAIPNSSLYNLRRGSIFGLIEANALGLAFIPLLSILIGYMLIKREKLYYLFIILGGIVAFLSNTRYIMIGFLLITFQALVFNKITLKGIAKFVSLIVPAFFFFYLILQKLGYNFQDWYSTRLMAEGSLTETTRYKAIDVFLKYFPQKPLLGFGSMTKDILEASNAIGSSHIHVGYLSHLVAFGLVGCFFLFSFWYLLVKRLYQTAKRTNYWGSFFAFLMFLWAFVTMSQSSIFYYGLLFAFVFDKYYYDKYKEQYIGEKINGLAFK